MQPDVSVLLPAFNEAPNLPEVLDELVGALGQTELTYEIVVVDDGSTDDSVGGPGEVQPAALAAALDPLPP